MCLESVARQWQHNDNPTQSRLKIELRSYPIKWRQKFIASEFDHYNLSTEIKPLFN